MRRTLGYAAAVLLGFGALFYVGHEERTSSAHKQCVLTREERKEGNKRAQHLKLVEETIIASNIKAQVDIPGYHFPRQVTELIEAPQLEELPIPNC